MSRSPVGGVGASFAPFPGVLQPQSPRQFRAGKFCPGHDSKFHSLAKKVGREQEAYPTSFVNAEAEAHFAEHVDRARVIWVAGQPLRDAKAADKAAKIKAKTTATTPVVESVEEVDADLLAEVTMAD